MKKQYEHIKNLKSLSYSGVKCILRSPAEYYLTRIQKPPYKKPMGASVARGKLIHAMVTGDWKEVEILPEDFNGRTKDGREYKQILLDQGKLVVSYKEAEEIRIVLQKFKIRQEFLEMEKEVAVKGEIQDYPFTGRIDAIDHNDKVIYDIKTYTIQNHASENVAISKSIQNMHYMLQAYIYRELVKQMYGEIYKVIFIFIRQDSPFYSMRPFDMRLDQNAMAVMRCQEDIRRAIELITNCQETGDWGFVNQMQEVDENGFYQSYFDQRGL